MTAKLSHLAFFLIFIFSLSAFGQDRKVGGQIVDQTNSPIAGATVVLKNQRTGLERISTTDAQGRFEFSGISSDEFILIGSAKGFDLSTVKVDENYSASIVLKPETLREFVTVVSGSRQEELRESLHTKVDVLTSNDIKTTGYETAGEALREVPGVLTRRGSETTGVAGEQVQGLDSRQVLVLLDGQPVTGARGIKGGTLNLDRQSTARLESIEVVKGAASALYGSDAIGGVVNMRLREQAEPFSASASAAGGSFGAVDLRGDIGFIKKRLSGIFGLERHKHNGFDFDPLTFSAEGAGFHRYDTFGRLKYQFTDRFALSGFANSYWNYSKGRVNGEQGPQTNDIDDNSQNYGLTADWAISDRTNVQFRGYFSRFDEYTRGKRYPTNIALADGNLFERYAKFDATVSHLFGERNFVQAGFEAMTDRYSGYNRIQNDRAKADTQVVWLHDKINVTDRLTITVGGRLDHHSVFGVSVSPKAAANYRLFDWVSLRASWGKGFRAPDLGQLFYRFSNPSSFYQVIGNPSLSPETAGSWQAGAEFSGFKRKARLGINYFRNDVRNLINSKNLGMVTLGNVNALFAANGIDPNLRQYITYNVLLFYYVNMANAYTQGAEVDGSIHLPKGFQLSGAYTFLEAYDKSTHRYLTGRHRHHGFLKLAYDNQRLGFNANFRGSIYSSWIASRTESTNAQVMGTAYQLFDLYGAKSLPKGFEIYGTIDNIFDNVDPARGHAAQQRLEAGRTFRIGVRWNFDDKK